MGGASGGCLQDAHHRSRITVWSSYPPAEGVSHFLYVATRARAGRPVPLLELEVQAEIDKFALLLLHLWRRGLRRMSGALRGRLFERVGYRAHLGAEARHRYREANRLGGGYARWLEGRYVEDADIGGCSGSCG